MNLEFNIIYTTGTVDQSLFFVNSLLEYWPCSFRLVANNCSKEEKEIMKVFCSRHEQLSFLEINSEKQLTHGEALTYLQRIEQGEYFCFMDSDILTSGNSLELIMPELKSHIAFFSAFPCYFNEQQGILSKSDSEISGRHYASENGDCLGTSFFAIYDNKKLTTLINTSKVDFKKYSWGKIPDAAKERIMELGLEVKQYDTGKVLNILLISQGEKLLYKDIPTIHHVGGVSCPVLQFNRWGGPIHQLILLFSLGRVVLLVKKLIGRKTNPDYHYDESFSQLRKMKKLYTKKYEYMNFFQSLLEALAKSKPKPNTPRNTDSVVNAKVENMTKLIIDLYNKVHYS